MDKRLLNIKDLSNYLSIPTGSLYVMVHMRKIPPGCIIKLGRSLRFEKAGIDRWVNEKRACS
jgi:predicted DNA-binding transcriptional regulator AlpA